jgi:hypothetical protein
MAAVEGTGVESAEIGQLTKDGTAVLDSAALEELKQRLGPAAWSKVRFVALNAPFARRSPIPAA